MGTSAFGTKLKRLGVAIAEIDTVDGVKLKADTIETTNHDSADGYKEFIQGIKEGGDVSIGGNFIPGDTNGQAALLTDFNNGTIQDFTITFPDATGTAWAFSAIVTGFETGAKYNDKITFSATVKITGKPTLTTSVSAGLTTPFFVISESAVVTPAKAQGTTTYVATVLAGVTSVTVTPTASAGVITVNGNTVATGVESSAITLGAAGSVTTITITVTETNKSAKTYTVYLSRAAS